MKGVLLAAGRGTRLRPFTYVVNKVVIPVYKYPMFYYGLKTFVDSGIKQIIIVSNPTTIKQLKILVTHFPLKKGVSFKFTIQKKPRGMVDAILSAKKMIGESNIMVFAADTICSEDYKDVTNNFKEGAVACLAQVKDPFRFGCPYYSNKGKLIKIVEKPKKPQSKFVVGSPYFFDNNIFNYIKHMTPSKRGELEITDLLNLYLKDNQLKLYKNKEKWFDAGTFDDLLLTSVYISNNPKKFLF